MASDLKDFSDSAIGFTKSPLGIIALFMVLVYGFATLALTFGNNIKENLSPLIYFLVFFPIIVFFGFLWLVSEHHNKIYGPSDFKDEGVFLEYTKYAKAMASTAVSLYAASSKYSNTSDAVQIRKQIEKQIDSIFDYEHFSKNAPTEKKTTSIKWKNKILWVDDQSDNIVFEKNAFESQGLDIDIASSTNEALDRLEHNKYAVIISDMGRKEGSQEGYVLLEHLQKSGNETPYFIYSGSDLSEQAKQRGAQGSTSNSQDLFEMVMTEINKDT